MRTADEDCRLGYTPTLWQKKISLWLRNYHVFAENYNFIMRFSDFWMFDGGFVNRVNDIKKVSSYFIFLEACFLNFLFLPNSFEKDLSAIQSHLSRKEVFLCFVIKCERRAFFLFVNCLFYVEKFCSHGIESNRTTIRSLWEEIRWLLTPSGSSSRMLKATIRCETCRWCYIRRECQIAL